MPPLTPHLLLLLLLLLNHLPYLHPYTPPQQNRRNLLLKLPPTLPIILTPLINPNPSSASGGATAGGAYLLSAKQRYNSRCKQGCSELLSAIKSSPSTSNPPQPYMPNAGAFKSWYESGDVGGWGDMKASGYLLSNAFRRSSSTPPEKLTSVKKWRVFEGMVETVGKKGAKGKVGGRDLEDAMREWMDEVELGGV